MADRLREHKILNISSVGETIQMKKVLKTWYTHLMQAVLNNYSDFFIEKIVIQFWLVLETQFYLSPIPLEAHQEETTLYFYFPLNQSH